MNILTGIPYVHNHDQTNIFISQGSTHDIKLSIQKSIKKYILVYIKNSDSTIDHVLS
jgi:hypothetical protein